MLTNDKPKNILRKLGHFAIDVLHGGHNGEVLLYSGQNDEVILYGHQNGEVILLIRYK